MPRLTLKKRSDGRYCAKADNKRFYGQTQSEALLARDAYLKAKADGLRAESQGITVDSYAAKWLPIAKSGVDDDTYEDYARMLNAFVANHAGRQLGKLLPSDLSADFSLLHGRSKSYIRKYTQLVRAMFLSAVDDGVILRSPFTKSVVIPDGTVGTHRALDETERRLIMQSVYHHDFAAAAMLMMLAGLRRGEMLALNIDRDVDFDKGVIHVTEAIKFLNNRPILTDPKTEAGKRDIPLFPQLRELLLGRHGLIVSSASGAYITEIGLRKKFASYKLCLEETLNGGRNRRWYGKTKADKALLDAGGKLSPWKTMPLQMHDFRHTFATMLWESGIDLKTAMKWMGHSDQSMLLRIYAHLTDKREAAAAIAMANSIDLINGPVIAPVDANKTVRASNRASVSRNTL